MDISTLDDSVTIALKSAGFITEDGTRVKGLTTAEEGKELYEVSLRHGKILDKIDLLYESPSNLEGMPGMPGHPCIYFKKMENISSESIKKIRKDIWNIGRAPILWIITPDQLYIYDAFARPEDNETEYTNILDILNITAKGLEGINQYKRQLFDTSKFWESEPGRKINPECKVDNSLLDDLWETERILTKVIQDKLSVEVAHSLLGRCIFMAYLWDRGIITPEFLKNKFGYSDIKELFNDKNQLYKFFYWLRKTFNGNLFPIRKKEEKEVNEDIHLKFLQKFFEGSDMTTMIINKNNQISVQKRLWPYNFEIIPIELISSIYEMFVHSKDPVDARAKSIHYTKIQLVELILSLAMKDMSDDACILDPACGSGVFLVDAFRRLAWKKRKKLKRELTHDEIFEILLNQIYGLDVEKGAIEVTAFSLYLALLELDEAILLEKNIKLPNLVYNPSWNEKYTPNLYVQDICNTEHEFNKFKPFINRSFDLIVGNLPWTELNKTTAPRDPDDPESGRQWTLEYIEKNFIPSNNPDQAIMIRVRDFAHSKTGIVFIVCSRIFYQQSSSDKEEFWLNSFLNSNKVYMVINLSDLVNEKILFGGKKNPTLPGSVIFYNPIYSDEQSTVLYVCPKWYPSIAKREEIIIHPSDVQILSLSLLKSYPKLWKIAFRGSQSDFGLIRKLSKNPSLKNILHQIGIGDRNYCRGYSKESKNREGNKDSTHFIGWPNLEPKEIKEDFKYSINSDKLPKFQYKLLWRTRNEDVYKAPLLIFQRKLVDGEPRIIFSNEIVIYYNTYFGVSFAGANERYAHRINAVFNSKITTYFAFMLGSEFGWCRRLIDDRDWLQMPLPKSILNLQDKHWNDIEYLETELRKKWNEDTKESREIKKMESLLLRKIFEVYELTEDEQTIINDTINYKIKLFIKRHARKKQERLKAIREVTSDPTLIQLEKYAQKVSKQLSFILAYEDKKVIYRLYDIESQSPLNVVEFEQIQKNEEKTNEKKKVEGIEYVLSVISDNLRNEISDNLFTWGHLRIYEKDRLFIIKPNEKRFWIESSALNDVSNIIHEHMRPEIYEKPAIIQSSW